jgi:tRNA splicing endonuclease
MQQAISSTSIRFNRTAKKSFESKGKVLYLTHNYEFTADGLVVSGAFASQLISSGYGSPRKDSAVEISSVEAVYLILKNKLQLPDNEAVLKKLASARRDFWSVYAIYSDLANQGKKLAYDYETGAIIQREGEKRGYIPLGVDTPMTLKGLMNRAKQFEEVGWVPVLAIVDEHGTPTYYSLDTTPPTHTSFLEKVEQ